MGTHFTKLVLDELPKKVKQLFKVRGSIQVWNKGNKNRLTCNLISISEDGNLKLKIVHDNKLLSKNILFFFELEGVSYLSEAVCSREGLILTLSNFSSLYKAERRTSFRMAIKDYQKVLIKFEIGNLPEIKESNVISIESKKSETGLFLNFLDLLDNETKDKKNLSFKVNDISLKGIGFDVGALEKKYLIKGAVLKDLSIEVETEKILIPEMKIVHVREYKYSRHSLRYRVGAEFIDLSNENEKKINRLINFFLDELEDEFENETH